MVSYLKAQQISRLRMTLESSLKGFAVGMVDVLGLEDDLEVNCLYHSRWGSQIKLSEASHI